MINNILFTSVLVFIILQKGVSQDFEFLNQENLNQTYFSTTEENTFSKIILRDSIFSTGIYSIEEIYPVNILRPSNYASTEVLLLPLTNKCLIKKTKSPSGLSISIQIFLNNKIVFKLLSPRCLNKNDINAIVLSFYFYDASGKIKNHLTFMRNGGQNKFTPQSKVSYISKKNTDIVTYQNYNYSKKIWQTESVQHQTKQINEFGNIELVVLNYRFNNTTNSLELQTKTVSEFVK